MYGSGYSLVKSITLSIGPRLDGIRYRIRIAFTTVILIAS